MKIIINDINKCETFIKLIHAILLINQSNNGNNSYISIYFNEEGMHINGFLYSCERCLFEGKVNRQWFNEYEYDKINDPLILTINFSEFLSILEYYCNNDTIKIYTNIENSNKMFIEYVNINNDITKYCVLSLLDNIEDNDLINIISEEMDVEIVIKREVILRNICMFNQNRNIEYINIDLNSEILKISDSLVNKELEISIKKGDIFYYTIGEGINITKKICKIFINTLCMFNSFYKDENIYELVIGFKKNKQMKISYNIGENSSISFYTNPSI